MKKILLLLMALILCFSFAACGQKDDNTDGENIVNPMTIYISMLDNAEDDLELKDFEEVKKVKFVVEEGSTVLEATQLYCVANDLNIELSSDKTYITSMAGITQGDYRDTTGWIYELNDETVMVSADKQELKEGDHISWEFLDWTQAGM